MPQQTCPLAAADTVVIIGGGPAGCSCGIRLRMAAESAGLRPRIILYEGKPLEKKSHYNQCLGVLSPPLDRLLEDELHVPFPSHIIQRTIEGYVLHTDRNEVDIPSREAPSHATRRVEFDEYIFHKARESGIEMIQARVVEVEFAPDGVMVYSESNNIRAAVVVGAFGLDDGMAKVFERNTSYRQPRFLSTIVTKIHPGQAVMDRFENVIHAFLLSSLPGVEFGALTPKGNHITVNLAGMNVTSSMMDRFLSLPQVRDVLPPEAGALLPRLYYFKGKFPTLPARGVVGDRYIMIGDAAGLNRPFKGKGINSAVITGVKAADAIVHHGVTRTDLRHYLSQCGELTDDIPYGRALRSLTNSCSRLGLLDGICETAKTEPSLRQAFFNIVSGQETYKLTWRQTRSLRLLFKTAVQAVKHRIFRR